MRVESGFTGKIKFLLSMSNKTIFHLILIDEPEAASIIPRYFKAP